MTIGEIGLAVAGGAVGVALVNKVYGLGEGILRPYQISRVAEAETKADIKDVELRLMAAERLLQMETFRHANMKHIVLKSLELIDDDTARPQDIDDDWIANLRDKSSIVSNEQMQELWARILAEEATVPGSFSRKTINIMADVDKRGAELFRAICGFAWVIESKPTLALYHSLPDAYSNNGIGLGEISSLVELGLINPIPSSGFAPERHFDEDEIEFTYLERQVTLRFSADRSRFIYIGPWEFTPAGLELYSICDPEPVDDFFGYLCDEWTRNGWLQRRYAGADGAER